MSDKLIVNFTPTGMIPTKKMTPHVPISISEIIEDVHRATEAGITMVHLHARDEVTEEPSYKKEIYSEIISGIRKFDPFLVICVSLSGRNFKELEQRADALYLEGDLKPDMGSLTLSSLNFNKVASMNSPDMIQNLAAVMMERGIVPELEAFDIGMVNFSKYLVKKNLLKPPYYFNLLLGNIACSQANLLHAGIMIQDLPENSLWSLAGIGLRKKYGVTVLAIRRNSQILSNLNVNTPFFANDVLFVLGPPDRVAEVAGLSRNPKSEIS